MKKLTLILLGLTLVSLTACKIFPWDNENLSRPIMPPAVPAPAPVKMAPAHTSTTSTDATPDLSNDTVDAIIPSGFTIASRDKDWINFDGSATVSGEYYEEPDSVIGPQVCFDVDEATGKLIPNHPEGRPWFCFADQEEVKPLLKIDDKKVFTGKVEALSGKATVTISHYRYTLIDGESWDTATLDNLVKAEAFTTVDKTSQ